jgi:hypothetical protein
MTLVAPFITAMDNTNAPEVVHISDPAKRICYLLQLPDDIKRYIALLAFEQESEEEFVKRTRIQKQVPPIYYEHLLTSNVGGEESLCNAVYCPYKINIALLKLLRSNDGPTITIIDAANNKLVHSEKLDQWPSHAAVAISGGATLFATTRETTFGYRHGLNRRAVSVLEVKNISTQKIQEFEIPIDFPTIHWISFNKQGTQVIMDALVDAEIFINQKTKGDLYPSSFIKIKPTSPYKVFDLKTDEQDKRRSVKSLEEHLRQQLICNDLTKSL